MILQSAFSNLEEFYDTVILPSPPRKPKENPALENRVRYLETYLVERLKEKIYISLESLNSNIQKIVAVLDARHLQNKNYSRNELFITC